MTDRAQPNSGSPTAAIPAVAERQERLAAALRTNLVRRKVQRRKQAPQQEGSNAVRSDPLPDA